MLPLFEAFALGSATAAKYGALAQRFPSWRIKRHCSIVWIFDDTLNPCSSSQSVSVYKFSLHYPYQISCLVMRIKQMIIQINLSKNKNKILPTCLKRNYTDSSGEFGNTSYHLSFDVLHLWLTGLIRYDFGWNHWRCLATSCIVVWVRHARNYMYSSFMVYNYCSYECSHSFYVS